MQKYYAIQQLPDTGEAHLYIYGDIVPQKWFDDETSADSFARELGEVTADTIHVHVDSYGGAVSEGWAIYNALRAHGAKIITHGDGFVASAALYPFMAGDERIASNLSAYFFHQVMTYPDSFNAAGLRAAAEEAEKLNAIGLSAFTNAGIDADTVLALENAETWLDANEALEYGFATAVVADQSPKSQQSARRGMIQRLRAQNRPETPEGGAGATTPPEEKAPETAENPLLRTIFNAVLD